MLHDSMAMRERRSECGVVAVKDKASVGWWRCVCWGGARCVWDSQADTDGHEWHTGWMVGFIPSSAHAPIQGHGQVNF